VLEQVPVDPPRPGRIPEAYDYVIRACAHQQVWWYGESDEELSVDQLREAEVSPQGTPAAVAVRTGEDRRDAVTEVDPGNLREGERLAVDHPRHLEGVPGHYDPARLLFEIDEQAQVRGLPAPRPPRR